VLAVVLVPAVAGWRPAALIGLAAAPFAARPIRAVLGGAKGRDLIPVLGMTGLFQLVFACLLAFGVAL
jgi:1,4-dihydroxy-2-naphthoate octaprenyltransferase